jgi:hypothetical protein
MSNFDMFKQYSHKIHGNLEDYLKIHHGSSADNRFLGPNCFFIIKRKGLMIPGSTCIRVDRSPVPDISYFVNSDYLLESSGTGEWNMSCIGAEKGVYKPREALKNQTWSISGLDLSKIILSKK